MPKMTGICVVCQQERPVVPSNHDPDDLRAEREDFWLIDGHFLPTGSGVVSCFGSGKRAQMLIEDGEPICSSEPIF